MKVLVYIPFIKRFDRTPNYEKLRMEDFSQILSKRREYKYSSSYEECADVIKQYSCAPELDLQEYYRRLIAYIIIGNCDAHLKNFSLLEKKEGLRLSPVYDVLNTIIYKHFPAYLALFLNGKKYYYDEITPEILINFGCDIGLSKDMIKIIFNELRKSIKSANKNLRPNLRNPFKEQFYNLVEGSCSRILTP